MKGTRKSKKSEQAAFLATLDPYQRAAHEAGGTLIYATLPTREQWDKILRKEDQLRKSYFPGCAIQMHVPGTNGGTMPCGGQLTDFRGTTQEFCEDCRREALSHTV